MASRSLSGRRPLPLLRDAAEDAAPLDPIPAAAAPVGRPEKEPIR